MCGLVGFYDSNALSRSVLERIGQKMTDSVAHRGSDDSGLWIDEKVGIAFGHHRLSISETGKSGAQPMVSRSGRYVLIYNGEIYNHLSMREKTNAYKGNSDTESFLQCVEDHGFDYAISQSNGMFAMVLWDKKERILRFARDRLGEKPLYIGWVGGTLIFSSELRAARTHPDMRAVVNQTALKAFLRFGYIPAPLCIYDGFMALPAGGWLTLSEDCLKSRKDLLSNYKFYWNAFMTADKNKRLSEKMSEGAAINMIEAEVNRSVAERMVSEKPVGAFLSGGIDSTLVVSTMQQLSKQKIKTYTIGLEASQLNEAEHAHDIAKRLGTDHHELILNDQQAQDIVPKLADIYDEPFADISQIPTYLVSKFAKDDVSVVLTGDGGDEVFGGYARHVQGQSLWDNMQWMPIDMRNFIGRQMGRIGPELWHKINPSNPYFGERMMKMGRAFSAESEDDLYRLFLSHWKDPSDVMISQKTTHEWGLIDDPRFHYPQNMSFAERMMLGDTIHFLPNSVLTKLDRASMHFSLEARAPLLDYKLYEMAWRLPHEMRIQGRTGKWILRQILYRRLPRRLVERPKRGFTVPMSDWLRGPLKDWAYSLIRSDKLIAQGYLNPRPIQKAWDDHQSGKLNNGYRLWNIVMFQAWLNRWML
jgi:asparagine synthase (glutamine-hydrolysing)